MPLRHHIVFKENVVVCVLIKDSAGGADVEIVDKPAVVAHDRREYLFHIRYAPELIVQIAGLFDPRAEHVPR